MTRSSLRFSPDPTPSQPLLICLPHAGGAASAFRAWPTKFAPDIAVGVVQYPGREDRFGETLIDNMPQLLAALLQELGPLLAMRPYALLGHSMGGAIAHELAVRLSEQGAAPKQLFISGRQPPRFHAQDGAVHLASDAAIMAELRRLSPRNQALVSSPELAALLVPIIRSDYRLIENYQPRDLPPLTCPIAVLAGRDDLELPVEQAQAWREYTTAECQVHFFPGDHFFISSQCDAVADTVKQALSVSLLR